MDVPSPPWLMPTIVSTRNSAPVRYRFQYLFYFVISIKGGGKEINGLTCRF